MKWKVQTSVIRSIDKETKYESYQSLPIGFTDLAEEGFDYTTDISVQEDSSGLAYLEFKMHFMPTAGSVRLYYKENDSCKMCRCKKSTGKEETGSEP